MKVMGYKPLLLVLVAGCISAGNAAPMPDCSTWPYNHDWRCYTCQDAVRQGSFSNPSEMFDACYKCYTSPSVPDGYACNNCLRQKTTTDVIKSCLSGVIEGIPGWALCDRCAAKVGGFAYDADKLASFNQCKACLRAQYAKGTQQDLAWGCVNCMDQVPTDIKAQGVCMCGVIRGADNWATGQCMIKTGNLVEARKCINALITSATNKIPDTCVGCSHEGGCSSWWGTTPTTPTDDTCTDCSSFGSLCKTCTTSRCTTCVDGHYLDSNNKCVPCSTTYGPGCSACSGNAATSCTPPFILSGGQCKACGEAYPQCSTCVNGLCTACNQGHWWDDGDKKCKPCSSTYGPGCSTCDATRPRACNPGYHMISGRCQTCREATPSCTECDDYGACKRCDSGFYLHPTSKQCVPCSPTHGTGCTSCTPTQAVTCEQGRVIKDNKCKTCGEAYPQCKACGVDGKCAECEDGFYWNSKDSSCTPCSTQHGSGCSTCTADNAKSCVHGHYLVNGKCLSCSDITTNCLTCDHTGKCTQCAQAYWWNSAMSQCTPCSTLYGPGCTACDGTRPHSCTSGMIIKNNQCTQCSDAFPACKACNTNTNKCAACNKGYFLDASTGECVTCSPTHGPGCTSCDSNGAVTCSSDMVLKNGKCKTCSDGVPHCKQCANGQCETCQDGYYLKDGACIKCSTSHGAGVKTCKDDCTPLTCANGYVMTAQNGCVECSAEFPECTACDEDGKCSTCNSGFYLDTVSGRCKKCSDKHEGCATCDEVKAIKCAVGWVMKNGKCKPLSQCKLFDNEGNCQVCNDGHWWDQTEAACKPCSEKYGTACTACDSTKPLDCTPDYVVDGNQCRSCSSVHSHCKNCNKQGQCVDCDTGFWVHQKDGCVPCSDKHGSGCSSCTEDAALTCKDQHILVGKTCKECDQAIAHCNLCDTANKRCRECADGYYLDSSKTQCLPCTAYGDGCTKCDDTKPVTCAPNWVIKNNKCKECGVAIGGCTKCNTDGTCATCSVGHFLDADDTECVKCQGKHGDGCSTCNKLKPLTCVVGWILDDTDDKCKTCGDAYPHCTRCNNNNKCQDCEDGYYLDPKDETCKACSAAFEGCTKCDSNGPKTCATGLVLKSNQCQSCGSAFTHCKQCEDNKCTDCNDGHWLHPSGACNACSDTHGPGCSTCTGKDPITCHPTWVLKSNECQTCGAAFSNCDKCKDNQCVECKDGFFWNDDSSACEACDTKYSSGCSSCDSRAPKKCSRGYVLSTRHNQCKVCSEVYGHCKTCNDDGQCMDCDDGHWWKSSSGVCEPCTTTHGPGCATCTGDEPRTCLPGHILDSKQCKTCSTAIPGCTLCDNNKCKTCDDGLYLSSDKKSCSSCAQFGEGCNTCEWSGAKTCKPNHVLVGSQCEKCRDVIPGCSQCDDDGNCMTCNNGLWLSSDKKSCNSCSEFGTGCETCDWSGPKTCKPEHVVVNNRCKPCDEAITGCTQCEANGKCATCEDGLYLSVNKASCNSCSDFGTGANTCDSEGSKTCKPNHVLVGRQCKPCSDVVPGCKACDQAGKCSACNNGMNLDSTANKCTCSGSTALIDNQCQSCTAAYGIACSACDSSKCTTCTGPYYTHPVTGSCIECTSHDQACTACDANGCKVCSPGTILTSGACKTCFSLHKISNCAACDSSKCTACAAGYTFTADKKQCKKCTDFTADCSTCNSNGCSTCVTGFYLSLGKCKACTANCTACNAAGCNACEDGYFLEDKVCKKCSSRFLGCSKCTAGGATACNDGSTLTANKCRQVIEFEDVDAPNPVAVANTVYGGLLWSAGSIFSNTLSLVDNVLKQLTFVLTGTVKGLRLDKGQILISAKDTDRFDAHTVKIGFTGGNRDAVTVTFTANILGSFSKPTHTVTCTRDKVSDVTFPSTFKNLASLQVVASITGNAGAVFALDKLEVS